MLLPLNDQHLNLLCMCVICACCAQQINTSNTDLFLRGKRICILLRALQCLSGRLELLMRRLQGLLLGCHLHRGHRMLAQLQ